MGRLWLVAFTLLAPNVCCAQNVQSKIDDTLLRAAYCAGALKESIALGPKSVARTCHKNWEEYKFASREECSATFGVAVETLNEKWETGRQRYARYVAARLLDESVPRAPVAVALAAGQQDARNAEAKTSTRAENGCFKRCDSKDPSHGRCVFDCIAQTDPAEAKLFRCQFLPDELPF